MSAKAKARPAPGDLEAGMRRPGLDAANGVAIAQLRLGCLKLAALFRTESTTPEQMKAKADEFLAYVMRAKI